MQTDEIRKTILLRATRERVWRAITDSTQFGQWFGVRFEAPFAAGQRLRGRIVPTTVDPEIAKMQEPWSGMTFDFLIDHIQPMDRFVFRWHPGGDPVAADLPDDQMTTVTFALADAPGGVLLTICESGFDRVPLERRAKAFTDNEGGWEMQTRLIEKFLARPAHA